MIVRLVNVFRLGAFSGSRVSAGRRSAGAAAGASAPHCAHMATPGASQLPQPQQQPEQHAAKKLEPPQPPGPEDCCQVGKPCSLQLAARLLQRAHSCSARTPALQRARTHTAPGMPPQSGCKVCVWDIYRSDLEAYNAALLAADPGAAPLQAAKQDAAAAASMDAFEALERQLQQQQQQQQQGKG